MMNWRCRISATALAAADLTSTLCWGTEAAQQHSAGGALHEHGAAKQGAAASNDYREVMAAGMEHM